MATIGDIVVYRMTDEECAPFIAEWDEDPRLAYRMNKPQAGMQFPALVVADHGTGALNLRVFLDSRDAGMWATARTEGTEPGTWALQADAPTAPETPAVPEPETPAEPTPPTTTTQES